MMGSCRPGGVGFVALWRGKNKAWADQTRQTERAWGGAYPISAGDRGVCTKGEGGLWKLPTHSLGLREKRCIRPAAMRHIVAQDGGEVHVRSSK